ncbi:MAG: diaminopimelate decarboxylase, partial [Phycisphaeraceae bacterium]|nr:diaminopimelate decarboxylase [Phycisphaeraceae bacterium]
MDAFEYRNGQLFAENVNVDSLADDLGTPLYVYSAATFRDHYQRLVDAFEGLDPLVCYSIKSCGNIHIIRLLNELGAGMDVVSGGELYRAQRAGVDPANVVYAGVGKTDAEIEQALEAGLGYFNIESEAEFENIAAIAARMDATATAALRVNPDVDPNTHAKTTTGKKETKFGVDIERARQFFMNYGEDPHLRLTGIHLHIGSPIYSADPYVNAIEKAMTLVEELADAGRTVDTLDIGGGFGADYTTGQTPDYSAYVDAIRPMLQPFVDGGGKLILEPGRTIAANAGILVTEVLYLKEGGSKHFVIVDSGMHHLLRPALYDAFHFIWPTRVDDEHVPG